VCAPRRPDLQLSSILVFKKVTAPRAFRVRPGGAQVEFQPAARLRENKFPHLMQHCPAAEE
jgi:hypothetical protein